MAFDPSELPSEGDVESDVTRRSYDHGSDDLSDPGGKKVALTLIAGMAIGWGLSQFFRGSKI